MLKTTRISILTTALLALTLGTAYADSAISVAKVGGELVLKGPDCSGLLNQARALSEWKREFASAETTSVMPTSCESVEGGYSLAVTGLTPKWAVDHQDVYPAYDGPNCWATASFLSGMIPSVISLDADEFTFHLSSSQCSEKPYSQRQAGDVVVIRSKSSTSALGFEEVHGFVFVTDALAYSKNGKSRTSPFALQDYQGVLSTYGVPMTCAENPTGSGCDSYAKIFHCEGALPIPSDLAENDIKKFQNFTSQISTLSEFVISGNASPEDLKAIKNLFSTLPDVMSYAEKMMNTSAIGNEAHAFWSQFYTQCLSVKKQQSQIDLPESRMHNGRYQSARPLIFDSRS